MKRNVLVGIHPLSYACNLLKKPTVAGLISEPSDPAVVFPPQAGGSIVQQPVSRSTDFFLRSTGSDLVYSSEFFCFSSRSTAYREQFLCYRGRRGGQFAF